MKMAGSIEQVTAEQKKAAAAHKDLGNKMFVAGRFDEAAKHFTDALNEDPTDHIFYSNRWGVQLHPHCLHVSTFHVVFVFVFLSPYEIENTQLDISAKLGSQRDKSFGDAMNARR